MSGNFKDIDMFYFESILTFRLNQESTEENNEMLPVIISVVLSMVVLVFIISLGILWYKYQVLNYTKIVLVKIHA